MAVDLGRRLIASGAVSAEEVEAALFLAVVRGIPFVRALVDRGAISERALEEELERRGGLALRQVLGIPELIGKLPRAMCRRLGAVPTRLDPFTGTVDVAAADPLDPHVSSEFAFHLGAPVRIVRAPISAIEEAIRRVELDEPAPSQLGRARRATPAFPHGAPQSSVPPPPAEEMPIPLVRKTGLPLIPEEDPTLESGEAGRRDSQIPMPLRTVTMRGERRPPVIREPVETPPSVRFPSDPPPSLAVAAFSPGPSTLLGIGGPRPPTPAPAPEPPPLPAVEPPPAPEPTAATVTAALTPATAAPPPSDLAALLRQLRDARSRDDVVAWALRALRLVARRVAVFAVRKDGFHGWACNVDFGDADALRSIVVSHDQPSVLATATATSVYLGPIPSTSAHAGLLAIMGRASPDVAAVAVRVKGKPALLLLADELDDTLTGTRRMDEVARAAGDALTRMLGAR